MHPFSYLAIIPFATFAYAIPACVEKTPFPKNSVCGALGTGGSKHVATQYTASVLDCAVLMNNAVPPKGQHVGGLYYTGPGTFSFNETSKLCRLYDGTAEGNGFKPDESSDTEYYERSCYDCKLTCPQKANLVLNPGFELSSEYAGPWDNGLAGTTETNGELVSPGKDSSNAFYCDRSCSGLEQWLTLCPGQHLLQYDIKPGMMSNKTNVHHFFRTIMGANFFSYRKLDLASPKKWATFVRSFDWQPQLDQGARLQLFSEQIPFYIDNVVVKQLSTPLKVTPGANNMLVNGDFETGSLAPWTTRSSDPSVSKAEVVDRGLNSSYALQWTFHGSGSGPALALNTIQKLTVKPGKNYVVSFEVFSPNTRPFLELQVIEGPKDNSKTAWTIIGLEKDQTYAFERLFKAEYEEVKLNIKFNPGYIEGKKDRMIYLDNVSIKESPQV